jgi:hypothetical protein
MTIRFIAIGLLALTSVSFGQTKVEPSPEVAAILERTGDFARPRYDAVFLLQADEKELLLNHFREQKRVLDSEPAPAARDPVKRQRLLQQAETAQAMLGDPQLIEEWLRSAREAPLNSDEYRNAIKGIRTAAQPETVIRLAPLMQVEEPLKIEQLGDAGAIVPRSFSIANVMFQIVETSPAFDGNTRKWAQDNRKLPAEPGQTLIRHWWKTNEPYFISGDFKSVKPGEDLSSKRLQEFQERHSRNKAAIKEKKRTNSDASASNLTTDAAMVSTNARPEATMSGSYLGYLIAAALFALLAAGLRFYSRSTRT